MSMMTDNCNVTSTWEFPVVRVSTTSPMCSSTATAQNRASSAPKRASRRIRDLCALKYPAQRDKLNTTGLPALPPEILWEISSQFLQPLIPAILEVPYPYPFNEHRKALWSLSRTCRKLREVFWPRLWSRLEVLSVSQERYIPKDMILSKDGVILKLPLVVHDTTFKEKQRTSEAISSRFRWLLNGGSHLRPLITTMNLWITDFDQEAGRIKVLSIILLERYLPYLRTLQLVFDARNLVSSQILQHFEGNVYPQIEHAFISFRGVEIFKCFPNVRTAVALCNHPCLSEISPFLEVVTEHCKRLQVLDGIPHQKGAILKVVKAFPQLQEVSLDIDLEGFFFPEEITELLKLDSLKVINLRPFYRPAHTTFLIYGASATEVPQQIVCVRVGQANDPSPIPL
ncbi:hypothetical protein BJ165DRAFT_371649 [Panaeolus papilionaceus]|nr:hypothetical protein BJ165DRAFT_371649 [Panaeolus papilionaceus]